MLRESAPRSGACDWPCVAKVAGAAFTGIHCSFRGGGGAGGRGGVLVVRSNTKTTNLKLSMAASKSTMGCASVDGAEDRQKTGVSCMPLFCRPLGILHL